MIRAANNPQSPCPTCPTSAPLQRVEGLIARRSGRRAAIRCILYLSAESPYSLDIIKDDSYQYSIQLH